MTKNLVRFAKISRYISNGTVGIFVFKISYKLLIFCLDRFMSSISF